MSLSKQQEMAVSEVENWYKSGNEQIFRLFSPAGCGKTYTARHFASGINGAVQYAAYTGKAAIVMQKSGCYGASTIHSLIYTIRQNYKTGQIRFVLDRNGPAKSASIIIIDECSMVDEEIGKHLLSFNVPILVLGDPYQLPPVKGAGFFTNKDPNFMLTEIHRQAEGNPIIELATRVRNGGYLEFGTYGDSEVIPKSEINKERVLASDQVLVGLNKSRKDYNERIRSLLGRKTLMPEKGDKLVCLKNNHELNIFNGGLFTALEVRESEFYPEFLNISIKSDDFPNRVAFEVPVRREFFFGGIEDIHWRDLSESEQFNYGYALTVHKCVTPNTIVNTENGLQKISDIKETGLIDDGYGLKPYKNKVHYKDCETLKFTTEMRYQIEVTRDHKMEVFDYESGIWIKKLAKDVSINDWFRICKDSSHSSLKNIHIPSTEKKDVREKVYETPNQLTEELSLFLGLMMADGTVFEKGFTLKKRHQDVCEKFKDLCISIFNCSPKEENGIGCYGYSVNSTFISRWLKGLKFLEPKNKFIPEIIMQSSNKNICMFLKGLFEDGYVNIKNGVIDHIELHSSEDHIINDVRQLLLKVGISSSASKDFKRLYIYSGDIKIFKEKIGFVSKFKNQRLYFNDIQKSSRKRVPLTKKQIDNLNLSVYDRQAARQQGYISKNKILNYEKTEEFERWEYVRVKNIENSKSDTFCVEVQGSNTFLQNGFRHGNSQGSSWDNIVLFDESSCFRDDWSRWLYTGITRAAKKITIVK